MSEPAKSDAPGDPSMEDILASIRRILSEDEGAPAAAAEPDVLDLDSSMLVHTPAPTQEPAMAEPTHIHQNPVSEPAAFDLPADPPPPPAATPAPVPALAPARDPLVAPEAAAAAATSVGSLVRTLTERHALVRTGGPTIEDIVREEMRPLLKQWLDHNLPALVERHVRAEIERVVGRAVP